MKKRKLLLNICSILFLGCEIKEPIEDKNVVFNTADHVIVIENDIYNLEGIEEGDFDLLFDQVEHKIWIHSILDNKSIFKAVNKDGCISEKIIISYGQEKPLLGGKPYINNNIALISSDAKHQYLCVNLIAKSYYIVNIERMEYWYKEKMGFSGNYIFMNDGYYNIELQKMEKYPINLRYPSYMAEIDRVIGLDSMGNIALVDCNTKHYELLPIKKRKTFPTKFYYPSGSLYYINDNYLYYSVFSKWYPEELYFTFFMTGFEPVIWYRYNRFTGENVKIKSPATHSRIIGVIN